MSEHDFSTLALPIPKGEWCDADERMFQACFAVLGQFVEQELGIGSIAAMTLTYRGYRVHSEGDQAAIDLWLWYREELPIVEAAYDREITECYGGDDVLHAGPSGANGTREVWVTPKRKMTFPHDYPQTLKDEQLRRLIEIRQGLWT